MSTNAWLEKSLAFYGSYHHNELNKFVHILFVWPILFTAQNMLYYAPPVMNVITPVALFSLIYGIYYFIIELPGIAGPLASAMVAAGFYCNEFIVREFPDLSWKVALGIHIFCWIAQILSHKYFERRAPAFLDNIVQALVMAPLFVVMETLFIFGYKRDLQRKVNAISSKNIAEFRQQEKEKARRQ